ncbi:hypothetical protein NDU88_006486 [Pleurodeles waltl]|uniref:Uncharacterized protein n=1 Tax=Pleurodeles waltl TaxID=8319 RepID=A0AAV7PL63_PLEWA|nr:hypothetical protein NDU88_006486 [Pleurodeles waltl]
MADTRRVSRSLRPGLSVLAPVNCSATRARVVAEQEAMATAWGKKDCSLKEMLMKNAGEPSGDRPPQPDPKHQSEGEDVEEPVTQSFF